MAMAFFKYYKWRLIDHYFHSSLNVTISKAFSFSEVMNNLEKPTRVVKG